MDLISSKSEFTVTAYFTSKCFLIIRFEPVSKCQTVYTGMSPPPLLKKAPVGDKCNESKLTTL